jgi:hypothetical protein
LEAGGVIGKWDRNWHMITSIRCHSISRTAIRPENCYAMYECDPLRRFKVTFNRAAALAVALLVFPGGLWAQGVGGTITTTVVQPASIGSLTSLSVTSSVVLHKVTPTTISAEPAAEPPAEPLANTAPANGGENPFSGQSFLGTPASFSVVGEPNQVFSIVLPERGMILTESSVIVISGFDHNGGLTPSVSAAGGGTFSVKANFDVADLGTSDAPAADAESTGSDGPTIASLTTDQPGSDPAQTENNGASLNTNFNFAVATEPPHFDIVVSYN